MLNEDEIVVMAKKTLSKDIDGLWLAGTPDLEAFTKLVADVATAKEREACAKVCESLFDPADDSCNEAEICAESIRARGETTLRGET